MESEGKSLSRNQRLARIILVILSVAVTIFFMISMINYSRALEGEVAARDSLINLMQKEDSTTLSSTKKYSQIITKYIEDCNILIDGKKVSTPDLVKLLNKQMEENQLLSDSLSYYKNLMQAERVRKHHYYSSMNSIDDSLFISKKIIQLVKQDYGISYEVTRAGNKFSIVRNPSTADSAVILFPYYKHKLKKDTIAGQWLIITESKIAVPETSKRKRNRKQ